MTSKLKNPFVSRSIPKLYLNADLADFTFTFRSENVHVHKIILANASPVFYAMFFGPVKDNGNAVEIVDSYADAFKEFLQFFYLSEVTLNMENIEEVAKLADKYDILDCLNTCADFIKDKLTADNMLWGYRLAVSLDIQQLKQFCEQYISWHTDNVFKSDEFLRCDRSVLTCILKMDVLLCNESMVFQACVSWAKYACQETGKDAKSGSNLRAQLGDCLYLIRFTALNINEFGTHTAPFEGLLTGDEIADIMFTITVPRFTSKHFIRKSRSVPSFNLGDWDSSTASAWKCKIRSNYDRLTLPRESCLRFSVNAVSVLGQICSQAIFNQFKYDERIVSKIEVIEYEYKNLDEDENVDMDENMDEDEHGSEGGDEERPFYTHAAAVLFNGTVELRSNIVDIPLTHGLILKPNKVYEVHMITKHQRGWFLDKVKWKPQIFDDGLDVKLLDSQSNSLCPVSSLHFRKI